MKKLLLIIFVLALLGGGYYVFSGKAQLPNVKQMVEQKVTSSIADAVKNAVSLKCDYTDEQGNKMTTYVKGTNVRITGYTMAPGQTGNALMKDGKMYMWDDVKKQGSVIELNMEDVAEGAQDAADSMDSKPTSAGAVSWTDTLAGLEKIKDSCKPETIADSMFTVPTDVTFTDFAAQMKDAGIDVNKLMEEAKKMQTTPTQ